MRSWVLQTIQKVGTTFLVFIALTAPIWAAPPAPQHYASISMNPKYSNESAHIKLQQGHLRRVQYLSADERKEFVISFKDGSWMDAHGKLLDGDGIYVMEPNGTLYFNTEHQLGKFHHSSFLGGKPVSGAGLLFFEKGKLVEINRESGHYKPSEAISNQVLLEFHKRGQNIDHLATHLYFDIGVTKSNITSLLSFDELFTNYRHLREGSPDEAKKALQILVKDIRGKRLIEKEFQLLPLAQDPLLQDRYALLIEEFLSKRDSRFNFLETAYRGVHWWEPEEVIKEQLRRFSALFKRLPNAKKNAELLTQSLNIRLNDGGSREFQEILRQAEFKPLLQKIEALSGSPLGLKSAPPERQCLLRTIQKLLKFK